MAKEKQSSSLVQFGDFSLDDAEDMKRESEATNGGGIIYKLKPGRTVIRVIPPKQGEKLMKVAYVHYLDVAGVGRISFNCPRLMAKRECKTCKAETQLLATGEDADFKKSKKLKAKRQVYMNMIVRGDEGVGPRVLRFGKMIEDQLIEIRQDADDGGNFAHPISGFDLKISRKGEGQTDTEYKVVASGARPSTLSEDSTQMQEWIDGQPELGRFLRVLSDENIDRKLNGEEESRDDDDAPRSRRALDAGVSKPKSKASKSIDEEVVGKMIKNIDRKLSIVEEVEDEIVIDD